MNTVQMIRQAQGLGFVPIGGGNIFGGNGGRGFDWSRLIDPISNFGNKFLEVKYAKDAAKYTGGNSGGAGAYPNNTLTAAQLAEIERARRDADDYASGSISEKGIKIGNTTISWPVLALGAVGIYLVQSPGFSRRR